MKELFRSPAVLRLREQAGVAPVITLSMIVLVTIAVGMMPLRALAQTNMPTNSTFANLVRQSVPGADPNASGDQRLTSRQDLIKLARSGKSALTKSLIGLRLRKGLS